MFKKLLINLFVFFAIVVSTAGCAPVIQTNEPGTPVAIINNPTKELPIFLVSEAQKDPLKDRVLNADLIVSGNITDQRSEMTNTVQGRIDTIYSLTVDKAIKGDPSAKEIFVRVPGGTLDGKTYSIAGVVHYSIHTILLSCLHKEADGIYTILPDGVVWEENKTVSMNVPITDAIGRVVKILIAFNIPVALPAQDIPPLPVGPVQRPSN
jgi:hypothetical protein